MRKKKEEKKDKMLHIYLYLTDQENELLETTAKLLQTTKSNVIRILFHNFLDKYKKDIQKANKDKAAAKKIVETLLIEKEI